MFNGCETWSLTPREEHRLRVFDKRALRKIFRPKRDKVTVERKRLHNGELYDPYFSPFGRSNQEEGDRLGMYPVRETGEVCTGFWWADVRGRDHSEDLGVNGRIMLKEVGCGGMDWISLVQDRERWRELVNAVMNLRLP